MQIANIIEPLNAKDYICPFRGECAGARCMMWIWVLDPVAAKFVYSDSCNDPVYFVPVGHCGVLCKSNSK